MRPVERSSLKGPITDFTISGFCAPREQSLFLPESLQALEVAASRTSGLVNLVFSGQTVRSFSLRLKLYPSNM